MKDMGEMLLRPEAFAEIVIGNTALVRAMVETGVRVVTSYPGSPTPEIAAAIASMAAAQRPFYFEFSLNEKVATEVAFGAALNGHLSVVFFKSVGLNVAADTFVQLPLMEIGGGLVVVLGDDPAPSLAERTGQPPFRPPGLSAGFRTGHGNRDLCHVQGGCRAGA